jgi:hypothetical protein
LAYVGLCWPMLAYYYYYYIHRLIFSNIQLVTARAVHP